jgi:hypothetical protein
VQGVLVEHRRAAEQEKIALQAKFDEEKHRYNKENNSFSRSNSK